MILPWIALELGIAHLRLLWVLQYWANKKEFTKRTIFWKVIEDDQPTAEDTKSNPGDNEP